MVLHRLSAVVVSCAALVGFLAVPAARAQQAQGQPQNWFMPGQPRPAAPERRPRTRAATPAPAAAPLDTAGPTEDTTGQQAEQIQVPLPPAPAVADVPRGALPPAAVIGVLGVPDVLRASVAYQAADKTITERRQKMNDDAQKEQVKLRDMGQALATDRAKLTADQIRAKEKDLQDRITESRRSFTERNRIIQEQGQYALLQIQRTLSDVVQKVAASRGMNLVLQRAEVAVNIPEFDITNQVTEVLNKVLPTVTVPAEGVSPVSANPSPVASAEQAGKPAAQKSP